LKATRGKASDETGSGLRTVLKFLKARKRGKATSEKMKEKNGLLCMAKGGQSVKSAKKKGDGDLNSKELAGGNVTFQPTKPSPGISEKARKKSKQRKVRFEGERIQHLDANCVKR